MNQNRLDQQEVMSSYSISSSSYYQRNEMINNEEQFNQKVNQEDRWITFIQMVRAGYSQNFEKSSEIFEETDELLKNKNSYETSSFLEYCDENQKNSLQILDEPFQIKQDQFFKQNSLIKIQQPLNSKQQKSYHEVIIPKPIRYTNFSNPHFKTQINQSRYNCQQRGEQNFNQFESFFAQCYLNDITMQEYISSCQLFKVWRK